MRHILTGHAVCTAEDSGGILGGRAGLVGSLGRGRGEGRCGRRPRAGRRGRRGRGEGWEGGRSPPGAAVACEGRALLREGYNTISIGTNHKHSGQRRKTSFLLRKDSKVCKLHVLRIYLLIHNFQIMFSRSSFFYSLVHGKRGERSPVGDAKGGDREQRKGQRGPEGGRFVWEGER